MTEGEKRQIIALWESGVPLEQIYRMMPYKRYRAVKMVAELRENGTLQPRKKNAQAIEAIANAWQTETKNLDELAEMFGYSRTTVNIYLRLSGVREGKRPPRNYKHCPQTAEIIADLQDGIRMPEIAKKYRVSRQYVHQIKQKLENFVCDK